MHKELLDTLVAANKRLKNFVGGDWVETKSYATLLHPCTGAPLLEYPDTQLDELDPFLDGLKSCLKSGLHNPLRNVERYLMLGQVSFKAAMMLEDKEVADHFAHLIQSVMPKSLLTPFYFGYIFIIDSFKKYRIISYYSLSIHIYA
jgi:1-pyrroline-5-carboxylate dehydrogenase